MSTLTIRLPDDTAQRLKSLAQSRGLSMNKLVEQLSAHALSAWDTENHLRVSLCRRRQLRPDLPEEVKVQHRHTRIAQGKKSCLFCF